MPFDGYTLNLVTRELSQRVIGSKIEKIHQPSKDSFIFHLRQRDGAAKLLISASSDSPRIQFTQKAPENPLTPPMLCMLLRKHLTGGMVTDIRTPGLDRVVFIDICATNEIGDKVNFTLCAELMAKHSNLILINSEGIILDAVKRIDFTKSEVRQVLPGFKYEEPPGQEKLNILSSSNDEIFAALCRFSAKALSSALLSTLEGVSPLVAREISCLTDFNDIIVGEIGDGAKARLFDALDNIRSLLNGEKACNPVILFRENEKPFDFSFQGITQYGFSVTEKSFESFSELLDEYYYEKDRFERTKQSSSDLLKTVSSALARAERKLEGRLTDMEACKSKDQFRIYAELILANQYSLKKGVTSYTLENFYDNYNPITIKADPALSPAANGQKYFKEYSKLKNAEKMLGALIEESRIETEYLASVLDAIRRADGYTQIAEIKAELRSQGYLKNKGGKGKDKSIKKSEPLKYTSVDGYTILVGRNNIQNEQITFKTGAKDDSWFHVQKAPGSHVVVLGNGDILPESTCREAAKLAVKHSSLSGSTNVPVDYTIIKEIKKPKNGKPGMVIYHTYNTMWV